MKTKIFIDGSEGTTGLRIHERFAGRDDVEILPIASELRKDAGERKRLINESDITFLCLPDVAARESVSLIENENVRIIDTSTAHRTEEGWAYGFPELSGEFRFYFLSISADPERHFAEGLSGSNLRHVRLQWCRQKSNCCL